MRIFIALLALLSLACASTISPRANETAQHQTWVDVLYPRNESYKLDKPMPVVLAVHNVDATAAAMGNYTLQWFFTRDGLGFGQGSFSPTNVTAEAGKPLVFSDFVDFLKQFQHKGFDFPGPMRLQVYLTFGSREETPEICKPEGQDYSMIIVDIADLQLGLELGYEGNYRNKDAVDIDLLSATGCPKTGGAFTATTTAAPTATGSSCVSVAMTPVATPATSCPYPVDEAMASSISSSVSVLMIPPPAATLPSYTPNRAAALPIQTGGLAAAGIVGAMMMI